MSTQLVSARQSTRRSAAFRLPGCPIREAHPELASLPPDDGLTRDLAPHGAFTFIELLVLVAIITVLVAMRWPALSNTKDRSLQAVDFRNYKQLMAAANMYASDNTEYFPGNGWGTVPPCWAHGANLPTAGTTVKYNTNTLNVLSNQQYSCQMGQLFPYVKSVSVFVCPADRSDPYFSYRYIYFTSYVWNGAVSGYGNLPSGRSYKITQFKPNSILQWEADENTPFYFNDCSAYPDEGVSGRHGNRTTVGLISGGTLRIPLEEY
jgi:type II secretory pathway pseudopilin PulG